MLERRLKEVRKAHGFTQQNIADILGVDRTTYTYYETGSSRPSIATLQKVAHVFNVSVAYLIGETDSYEAESSGDEPLKVAECVDFSKTLTKKEKELILYFRSLDNIEKEKAFDMVKETAQNSVNNNVDEDVTRN